MNRTLFAAVFFSSLFACDAEPPDLQEGIQFRNAPVVSEGDIFGYLLDATRYTISVFNPENNHLFQVNPETGFIIGTPYAFYTTLDCSGTFYMPTGMDPILCPEEDAGRQIVLSNSEDPLGLVQPSAIHMSSGLPIIIGPETGSFYREGQCFPLIDKVCVVAYPQTPLYPLSFDTPITFSF